MKLEPANIVCPACGNANYMRHLIEKNVGHLDLKCINCNSYFNFDELYKRRIGEALKPKPITNADFLRSMSDEEFATAICKHDGCPFREAEDDECLKHHCDCKACWLDWLKQEVKEGERWAELTR